MTLIEFLLARIYDDEAAIYHLPPPGQDGSVQTRSPTVNAYLARWNPERTLAECEAKRGIIERHQCDLPTHSPDYRARPAVLRDLAAVYADHPDYQEDWRP